MNLLILGAGNFAKDIVRIAQLQGYDEIAYLDDDTKSAKCFPVIGGFDDVESFVGKYTNAIVAVGNNIQRMQYLSRLSGFNVPTLIDPTAEVSSEAELGAGTIVKAASVIKGKAKIGKGVILNDGSKVGPSCIVGDGCHFLPSAGVANRRKVQAGSWVDSYAIVE